MSSPASSVATATPRAAPRRRASCVADSLLEGAGRACAASGVPERARWHSGLEYVVRVTPGGLPVATEDVTTFSGPGLGAVLSVLLGGSPTFF